MEKEPQEFPRAVMIPQAYAKDPILVLVERISQLESTIKEVLRILINFLDVSSPTYESMIKHFMKYTEKK